jgi:hypothetical protein
MPIPLRPKEGPARFITRRASSSMRAVSSASPLFIFALRIYFPTVGGLSHCVATATSLPRRECQGLQQRGFQILPTNTWPAAFVCAG